MSQTQTRKQKILGDVKKKRRQRTIISLVIAVALIAIIVGAVIVLTPAPNKVPLPPHLSSCVNAVTYHYHPNLVVTINGVGIQIPVTFDSSCPQPIHTHDSTGVLHIESDQNLDYTLGDWFLLWGHSANNPTTAILSSTQIFDNKVDATHHLTMTVNGQIYNATAPQAYVFPKNAQTGGNSCSIGNCQPDSIVLTYGP